MKKFYLLSGLLIMTLLDCNTPGNKNPENEGDFSNLLTEEEKSNARFTPEILWKFGRVGDMQLSPDGSKAVYTVTRYDAKTDKRHTWIYLVSMSGGDPVNLTDGEESCSNPRWVDSTTIAYLGKKDDRNQIWTMKVDGSGRKVVSEIPGDINAFGFASNGISLFYTQDVKLDSNTQDTYPDLPLAKGMVFDGLMYRHWDSWHDYAYSHIFISRFENGKIEQGKDIMESEHFDSPLSPYFSIEEISWNADGSKLAYTCKKLRGREYAESTNSDIYLYDLKGTTTNITQGMPGYEKYPAFSPDGTKLAFMSMETPGYEADKERLFVFDFKTGETHYLTGDLDQNAAHFAWTHDSRKIYFISGIGTLAH